MTTVESAASAAAPAVPAPRRRSLSRGRLVAGILAAWLLLWIPLRGKHTLALDTSQLTDAQRRLNELRDQVVRARGSNPFFTDFVNVVRGGIDRLTELVQSLISQPAYDRPVPVIGWLGVVALVVLAAYAFGNWRAATVAGLGFVSFGLLGYWQESMDTLALTITAVLLSLALGIPAGIWMGLSRPVERALTPLLDFMQAVPTFVYLAPLTLFFLIGPASAVIATLIYAMPPVLRLTAFGIREVQESALEASRSLGATRWQLLRKVQLPLAKRTIVVGINQTTMCALSMVTIAALIDAPGLGRVVLRALQILDVGTAFRAGLAIVVMAIVLDRVTTAASVRADAAGHGGAAGSRWRRWTLGGLGAATLVALYLAYTFVWAAVFPGSDSGGPLGARLAEAVGGVSDWVQLNLAGVTEAVRNGFSYGLLNPLEDLIAGSPWYLASAVVLAVAGVLGGWRVLPVVTLCLALLLVCGLWHDAMVTLTATLVATGIVMLLGVVFGVWMGRSDRADRVIRPVLDAAQVMPAFVYLVSFLGLFGPSRFTGIVAAVVFGMPVATKIVADGIRAVPATVLEAAAASGSTAWQVIGKVQLPLARRTLALATNQGLIYVLSMTVVGGLVGGGALGYLVVAGFSQYSLYGKGLAAGVAIVLLCILLDRITQAAARRPGARS